MSRKKLFAPALLALALSTLGLISAPANAAPAQLSPNGSASVESTATGPQAQAPVEMGKVNAKVEKAKGATRQVAIDEKTGVPLPQRVAADTSVNFSTFYDYCSNQFSYTTLYNSSGVTKYYQVQIYNQGSWRTFTSSVAAYSYSYPYFYGVIGSYSAYLYVWNGSAYAYDEYKAGNNTCSVSVTRACSTVYPHWLAITLKNNGTAYVSQLTQKTLPTPQTNYYDYPAAGGASVIRWLYIGGANYAVTSHTLGSSLTPSIYAGYC